MVFENPAALWLLPVALALTAVLGLWGWLAKAGAARLFGLDLRRLAWRHVEKHVLAALLLALVVLALAWPVL
ncbi:MAG TPA: hypothetical protein PLG21_06520, partial [Anaerolineae bacterium]|nr:hypothetical protein [Anaerolineae bacterium]